MLHVYSSPIARSTCIINNPGEYTNVNGKVQKLNAGLVKKLYMSRSTINSLSIKIVVKVSFFMPKKKLLLILDVAVCRLMTQYS